MIAALYHIVDPFQFSQLEQTNVMQGAIGRLLMACLLGGFIGLEREIQRKSAGVRKSQAVIEMG